jgi:hypothetical protein
VAAAPGRRRGRGALADAGVRHSALETLGPGYKHRFDELSKLAEEVNQMAIDNPCLENDLIQGEMDKLGGLLHSFLQMGLAHQRLFEYVRENDETEIQREIARLERAIAVEKNREVNASLRQSLALSQKRMRQHAGIEAAYKVLTVKMETLEKAFRYLKTHILSVTKREDLAAEIDGLVSGVESVEELTADTGSLMADLRSVRAAQSIKGH